MARGSRPTISSKVAIDIASIISSDGGRAGYKVGGKNAVIWVDRERGLMCVRTPFSEHFVREFKSIVPESDRDFAFDLKVWKFTPHHLNGVVELTKKYFTLVMLPEIKSTHKPKEYEAMLCNLSPDGLKKVWRVIAMELHPDKGGDASHFALASEAYKKLVEGKNDKDTA